MLRDVALPSRAGELGTDGELLVEASVQPAFDRKRKHDIHERKKGGEITDGFKFYYDLAERLAGYPVLDEGDYGRREYEATVENIAEAAWRLKGEYGLNEGWEGNVFCWFWDHRQRAVENRDDRGG